MRSKLLFQCLECLENMPGRMEGAMIQECRERLEEWRQERAKHTPHPQVIEKERERESGREGGIDEWKEP